MRLPPFTPRKIAGTHFFRPQGHSATGRIWSIEKSSDFIGNRTGDLPAGSTMPRHIYMTINLISSGHAVAQLVEYSRFDVKCETVPVLNQLSTAP
jgi:hypothetical protein